MPQSIGITPEDGLLDGESVSSCQMWPTSFWPATMWPLAQWPYCIFYTTPIPYACVVTLCCTDLINTLTSDTDLKQIATISNLNLLSFYDNITDLKQYSYGTTNLLSTYAQVCDLLATSSTNTTLICFTQITNLDLDYIITFTSTVDVNFLNTDLISNIGLSTDLLNVSTSETDFITVYEIEGNLCTIGGSCHVC